MPLVTSVNAVISFDDAMSPTFVSTHPDGTHTITTDFDLDDLEWRTYTNNSEGTTELSQGVVFKDDYLDEALKNHFDIHGWVL